MLLSWDFMVWLLPFCLSIANLLTHFDQFNLHGNRRVAIHLCNNIVKQNPATELVTCYIASWNGYFGSHLDLGINKMLIWCGLECCWTGKNSGRLSCLTDGGDEVAKAFLHYGFTNYWITHKTDNLKWDTAHY